MFVDLKNKFNYIVNLKDKISEFKKEYHRQIDTFQKDNNQTQSQINQLFFERDQLIKENSEMKNELNKLNYLITYQKSESNDRMKKIYEDKLSEYKNKIIILKNRVNELLGIESHGNYLSTVLCDLGICSKLISRKITAYTVDLGNGRTCDIRIHDSDIIAGRSHCGSKLSRDK